jgi:hypothetical protein
VEHPQEEAWLNAFGVLPERHTDVDEAWMLAVALVPDVGEELRVSWDVLGGSIRFRWTQGDLLRLDLYREGVSRLDIPVEAKRVTRLRVDYRQDGLPGVIHVQVWPNFAYTEALLHAG